MNITTLKKNDIIKYKAYFIEFIGKITNNPNIDFYCTINPIKISFIEKKSFPNGIVWGNKQWCNSDVMELCPKNPTPENWSITAKNGKQYRSEIKHVA